MIEADSGRIFYLFFCLVKKSVIAVVSLIIITQIAFMSCFLAETVLYFPVIWHYPQFYSFIKK